MSSSVATTEDSPSAGRRKALKEADAAYQLRVLGSCPLSKYIAIADRLLEHFQDALDGRRLDEAYVFGLRFANLCLSGLPQHPGWKNDPTIAKSRARLTSQVGVVLGKMDVIKQRMDAEELMKIKEEMIARENEAALRREEEKRAKEQVENAKRRKERQLAALEAERAQFLSEQRLQREEELKAKKAREEIEKKAHAQKNIEQSAMAKLQALQSKMPPAATKDKVEKESKCTETTLSTEKKSSTKEGTKSKSWFGVRKEKESKSKTKQKPSGSSKVAIEETVTESDQGSTLVEGGINPDQTEGSFETEPDTPQKKITTMSSSRKVGMSARASSDAAYIESSSVTEEKEISATSEKLDSTCSIQSQGSIKTKILSSITAVKSKTSVVASTISNALPAIDVKRSHKTEALSQEVKSVHTKPQNASISGSKGTIISVQQSPRTRKEQQTIERLQYAITAQEDRLEIIENEEIPYLLESAKTFLREEKKKEALKCLAHKKRLERQVDTIKAAVFNMETQMFMLESAYEDLHVKKALAEAASAIAGYQHNIGDPKGVVVDLTNMPELEIGDATDEELMDELNEWLSPEERNKAAASQNFDENVSVLSIPAFLPAAPEAIPTSSSSKFFAEARLPNPVLGE